LFHPLAEDNGVNMIWNVPDKCILYGDIRMIQRMISNLLDNAIKYTQSGGTVYISVHEKDEKSVVVSVKDTGIGISSSDLPHIFERFYRGDPSRAQTGSGLGLSLARAIAQAHGGDIAVAGSPNKGSNFTVTLPRSSHNPS
jgi:signal transduction histidine kinase